MKHVLYISFLISTVFLTKANNSTFEDANSAYKAGEFNMAIELYDSILHKESNSQLLYNLANAYYKTGRVPEAILNYEKAHKLVPNDKDIRHNLAIAQLQLKDEIEPKPEFFLLTWWKQLAKKQKANQWTIYFFISLWLGIILFLLFAISRFSIRKFAFFSGIGSLFCAFLFLILSFTQHKFETDKSQAIIMTTSVSVKSAPLNTGKDLFIIHSGLKVSILKQEGEWFNIRLLDGKEGWISQESLAVI